MLVRLFVCVIGIFTLSVMPVMAERVIRGVVMDEESGAPLPQATVQVLGTYEGAITNLDGAYELVVKQMPAVVRVSYIGYQSVEIVVVETTEAVQNVDRKSVV